jgi:hypothetical protein
MLFRKRIPWVSNQQWKIALWGTTYIPPYFVGFCFLCLGFPWLFILSLIVTWAYWMLKRNFLAEEKTKAILAGAEK